MSAKYHQILKPPDTRRVFTIPITGIRRDDADVLVYDVRVGPETSLRHYSFRDRWFQVNVSRDRHGRLVTEAGPGELAWLHWSFNCDICTPLQTVADGWRSVDLEIDILAAPDGKTYVVKDEDDFAHAVAAGYIDPTQASGARHGLAELQAILATPGGLLAFLNDYFPLERGPS
jgi:hypothetical protein